MMNAKIRTSRYKHYIRCGPSTQAHLDLIIRGKGLLLANRNRTSDRWISLMVYYSPPLYQLSYRENYFHTFSWINIIYNLLSFFILGEHLGSVLYHPADRTELR